MAKKIKLLIVGSDSMSYRIATRIDWPEAENIRPLMAQTCLVEQGKQKMQAWLTGPNWGAIYCGVGPEKHGITAGGWLMEHDNWLRLKETTIWDELLIRGISVGMMTMPITWPAIAGFDWMVSGFPVPDDMRGCFEPASIRDYMPIDFIVDWLNQDMSKRSWIRGVRDHLQESKEAQSQLFGVARMKTDYLLELVSKVSWPEVVAVGYTILDRVHHAFPSESEFTLKAYKFQRDLLAELLEELKPEKYIVVSDHGSLPDDLWHDPEGTLISKGFKITENRLQNTAVKGLIEEVL